MVDDPSQKILCSKYKDELNNELKTFISYLNIGLETDNFEEVNFLNKFSSLPDNVRDNCPLLFDVLNTLFLHKEDVHSILVVLCTLSLLVSLWSQKIKNDFKLAFTCFCISFGAGMRFITMLNKLGLTVSWDKAMSFLDIRKVKQVDEIKRLTPFKTPVILMFDNVNMYRGKYKHLNLWNFTCQAILVPDMTGLEENIQHESTCLQPQKPVQEIYPSEIFVEADQEKKRCFSKLLTCFF